MFDVEILTFDSVLSAPQPAETIAKFDVAMSKFSSWEMAGASRKILPWLPYSYCPSAMERVTYVTKSFIVALALVKGRISADQAALAAHVEVNSQIERWGEVEDCECLPVLHYGA